MKYRLTALLYIREFLETQDLILLQSTIPLWMYNIHDSYPLFMQLIAVLHYS